MFGGGWLALTLDADAGLWDSSEESNEAVAHRRNEIGRKGRKRKNASKTHFVPIMQREDSLVMRACGEIVA